MWYAMVAVTPPADFCTYKIALSAHSAFRVEISHLIANIHTAGPHNNSLRCTQSSAALASLKTASPAAGIPGLWRRGIP